MEFFLETISPQMKQVMSTFGQSQISAHFYLAGGTALALYLGHRRSFDLDFFSPTEDVPSIRLILQNSLQDINPILSDTSWGNLVFLAAGVRVGFYGYGYDLVAPFILMEGIKLASVEDIGLMKLDALLGRASRKDFHDLYAICQFMSIRQLLDLAPRKYPGVRDFEAQVVKRLVYFEGADEDEPLPLLHDVSWETVKNYFREQALTLGKSWLV